MSFYDLAKKRYSVRSYSDRLIDNDTMMKIFEIIKLAPTAMNRQPQRVYAIMSEEGLRKINSIAGTYNPPVVLLFCGDLNDVNLKSDGTSTLEMDVSIVATHVMLQAEDLGLNTVWLKNFEEDKVNELFNLPENIKPVLLMSLGYQADDAFPSPKHFESKALGDMVEIL